MPRFPSPAPLALFLPLVLAACGGHTAADVPPLQAQANFEQAVALLQLQSHNPDAAIRANCMEAVQVYANPRVTTMLEQGLHDSVWVVRFSAAMSAGAQKNAALKPALDDLLKTETNESVLVAIVYAQRRLGDATNMNLLAQTLKSPDPQPGQPEVGGTGAAARANTALILGRIGDPSAIVLLETAMRDRDPRVKLQVTAALAILGDHDAQEAILALAVNRYAEDIYTALATAALLNHPQARNVLIHGLDLREELHNPTPRERIIVDRAALIAARGIGQRGDTDPNLLAQAGQLAVKLSGDQDPSLRSLAAHALGAMLYPNEEANLVRLMADPDIHVQIAAAAAVLDVQTRADHNATPAAHT